MNDVHHEKTDLKVFVVVIPKEGLAGWDPANPSLGMTPTINYCSTAFIDYILQSVSYPTKIGRAPARPSFFGYGNDKELKVCFLMMRVECGFTVKCPISQSEFIGFIKTSASENLQERGSVPDPSHNLYNLLTCIDFYYKSCIKIL